MNQYKVLHKLGEGAFASVTKAVDNETGEIVAIKTMKSKFYSWKECVKLPEVQSLRTLAHPNVIKLKAVIREKNTLHLVFEYMNGNLYEIMKDTPSQFSESRIRNVAYQILQGLAYVHKYGYFHRDMKPENLLVVKDTIKIADFGLAREIRSRPPYTEYVSTRWYRAPECVLRSKNYNSPIDMWAAGAIIAELYMMKPIFPGQSTMDQLVKIFKVMGSPTLQSWEAGVKMGENLGFQFPTFPKQDLSKLMPNASPEAVQLIGDLLQLNPNKRPTAQQALQYPFFRTKLSMGSSNGSSLPLDHKLLSLSNRPQKRSFHSENKPPSSLSSSSFNKPASSLSNASFASMHYKTNLPSGAAGPTLTRPQGSSSSSMSFHSMNQQQPQQQYTKSNLGGPNSSYKNDMYNF